MRSMGIQSLWNVEPWIPTPAGENDKHFLSLAKLEL